MNGISQFDTRHLDSALAGLCAQCPYLVDEALDFRGYAQAKTNPGRCVRSFFGLMGEARQKDCPELECLRSWMQESVEISVRGQDKELERLPFQPGDHDDLETYCHAAMRMVSQDRAYPHTRLKMRFEYRP